MLQDLMQCFNLWLLCNILTRTDLDMTTKSLYMANESVKNSPYTIRRYCFILYCRLYKFFNTCYLIECLNSLYYGILAYIIGNGQKLEWKTHWQSPVCRAILRRKYFMSHSKSSLSWAIIYFCSASLLFIEIKSEYFSSLFGEYSDAASYVQFIICMLIYLNSFIAFIFYIWSILARPVEVSPIHQRLFRINVNDQGFELKKKLKYVNDSPMTQCMQFSSWRNESLECSSPSVLSVTPLNYSVHSWGSQSSGSPSLDTTSSSWSFYRSSPAKQSSTLKHSFNASLRRLNQTDNIEHSFERRMKSKKQLDEFLKVCDEEHKRLKSLSFEDSKSFLLSIDNSPMSALSKCLYQHPYRILHAETPENDSSDNCAENVLNKLKITDKMLTKWCENIRKWICQTILVKIVQEVDEINSTLTENGLPEFQIGNINLFALHQIAITKSQHLPTLAVVLPYLDMHLNQEYLVKRLRDLAHGGCMGEFKWNLGGSYDGKQWCDDLPTDSSLILHVLCCYFDSHLPPEPHFPEGKPFSSKYFKKTPEKILPLKEAMYIYQFSTSPPQFKVIFGEDTYAIPKGRNNLFYAVVIFLYCLKVKECGMLGRVNLGPSGLNILWVLD